MDLLTPPFGATAPGPTATTESKEAATKLNSDFDTFLRLLTAQISNQDPLDPMKPEQFASQLATFSNVEQSVRTNELLEQMLAQGGGQNFADSANWIGRDARASMPVRFDGDPITVDPSAPTSGSRHELVVTDALGIEVDRRQIGDKGEPLAWTGTTGSGAGAAAGLYSFRVDSFEGDALLASSPAEVYGRVVELRGGPAGASLVFDGGVEIPVSDATALRRAG